MCSVLHGRSTVLVTLLTAHSPYENCGAARWQQLFVAHNCSEVQGKGIASNVYRLLGGSVAVSSACRR